MGGAKEQRGLFGRVAEDVVANDVIGPTAEEWVQDYAHEQEHADCEYQQPLLPIAQELNPEKLHRTLGPHVHVAQAFAVHLGNACRDLLLHINAALALTEARMRRGRAFSQGPRVEEFLGYRSVILATEIARMDHPNRVGAARGDPAASVADDVHDVEGHAAEGLAPDVRGALGCLHQANVVIHLVLIAIGVSGYGELGQAPAPEVGVRLVPGVEDAEEHAARGVRVRARAEVAVAELQKVHHEVQGAALPAHAEVWHHEVPLHDDRGVAANHAPVVAEHLDAADAARAKRLDGLAGPGELHDEVALLLPLVEHEAAQVRRHVCDALLKLLAELPLELLGHLDRRAGALEDEVQARAGKGRAVHGALAAAAALLLGLQGHQAHTRLPRAIATCKLGDNLQ
mmetsp:Transcript_115156/g.372202  ORF Transcript_115156/g.372202 Transcript_115156/m.372202 type:complete len:400 (-) Transcript_115156:1375-2574(-)